MLQDSTNCWKIFSTSCWLWKRYPWKCCWDAWSGSWLARGQVNMVDEAKLCSPICSTFESLVVLRAVRHCHGEGLGPFCWPMWLQALQFSMHLIGLLSILLRCNGFARIQKAVVDQMGCRPPNSDHDLFFWCKFGFGKCSGASSQSSHWASHQ